MDGPVPCHRVRPVPLVYAKVPLFPLVHSAAVFVYRAGLVRLVRTWMLRERALQVILVCCSPRAPVVRGQIDQVRQHLGTPGTPECYTAPRCSDVVGGQLPRRRPIEVPVTRGNSVRPEWLAYCRGYRCVIRDAQYLRLARTVIDNDGLAHITGKKYAGVRSDGDVRPRLAVARPQRQSGLWIDVRHRKRRGIEANLHE